ncbi:hypothetical protein [Streptomyces californicus]|uniref:hypothetical protein n=1 Tax=Streptomyces californicus TaxID=67351 RepID=UPI00296EB3E1|nr:hypothetical protein [Streptomyces californicus]MDW4912450.1 hypothetical protein [Streptomyces californicus]
MGNPLPNDIIRAVTDAYLKALHQGDLHGALGIMTRLATRYGLPAVRDLATELTGDLHTHCPPRFRDALGRVDISALAPARHDDPLTTIDVATETNRLSGRGYVTAADLDHTEEQIRVTETVRRTVQDALNAASGQGRPAVSAVLAPLHSARELSAAVALLTNGLYVVLR